MNAWIELNLHGGKRCFVNLRTVVAIEDHIQGAIFVLAGKPSPMQVQQNYDEVLRRMEAADEVDSTNATAPARKPAGAQRR